MVASSCQISLYGRLPRFVTWGLLHDNPFCPGSEPDPEHLWPQTVAITSSNDGSGKAGPFAGRTAEDDVGFWWVADGSDIFIYRTREMIG